MFNSCVASAFSSIQQQSAAAAASILRWIWFQVSTAFSIPYSTAAVACKCIKEEEEQQQNSSKPDSAAVDLQSGRDKSCWMRSSTRSDYYATTTTTTRTMTLDAATVCMLIGETTMKKRTTNVTSILNTEHCAVQYSTVWRCCCCLEKRIPMALLRPCENALRLCPHRIASP